MNAQERFEIEEADKLEAAKEYQRQGHSLDCSAAMAWTGQDCICEMEGWLAKRKEG